METEEREDLGHLNTIEFGELVNERSTIDGLKFGGNSMYSVEE